MTERYRPIPCEVPPPTAFYGRSHGLIHTEATDDGANVFATGSTDGVRLGAEEARRLARWLSMFADSRIQTAADPGAGEGPGSAAPTTYLDEDD